MSAARSAPALTLIKLGGSLITGKRQGGGARRQVIRRLAAEIAAAGKPGRLVVGHGSGSFGHPAAARHGVHRGIASKAALRGVAETQARAAALHRLVVAALLEAEAAPFSLAPSSFMSADRGRPVGLGIEPLLRAIDLGLLPVTYGDVVLDRSQGSAICSTETVFEALVRALQRRGWPVERILWLGETEGVYDGEGALVPRIDRSNAAAVLEATGGAAGTDVTGGMRHRLETALGLARLGVESWILDGRSTGRLARALTGRRVPGTRVPAQR